VGGVDKTSYLKGRIKGDQLSAVRRIKDLDRTSNYKKNRGRGEVI